MKTKVLAIVFLVLAVILIIFLFSKNSQLPSGLILFYREDCPHCINVENYVKENGIEQKVKFEKKEVLENKDNARLLEKLAKKCGLPTDKVGVPFLWDGQSQKCLVGDVDIINFFSEKIK
jgi:glutaredoxin